MGPKGRRRIFDRFSDNDGHDYGGLCDPDRREGSFLAVGLGHADDDLTDTGEPDGSIPPNLPPIDGSRDPADQLNAFVIEADVMEKGARHTRVNIDPDTGVITEQDIKGSP